MPSIFSRKGRKAREEIWVSVGLFAQLGNFFYHEGHEEHEGLVRSLS
jgi:hypothetical protein